MKVVEEQGEHPRLSPFPSSPRTPSAFLLSPAHRSSASLAMPKSNKHKKARVADFAVSFFFLSLGSSRQEMGGRWRRKGGWQMVKSSLESSGRLGMRMEGEGAGIDGMGGSELPPARGQVGAVVGDRDTS